MEALTGFFLSVIIFLARPVENIAGKNNISHIQDQKLLPTQPIPTQPSTSLLIPSPKITPLSNITIIPTSRINPPIAPTTFSKNERKNDENNTKSNLSVKISSPNKERVFKEDDYAEILIEKSGEIIKLEIFVGSGMLIETIYQEPYKVILDLKKYVQGITGNYKLPFAVKGYDVNGKSVYDILDINIVPSGTQDIPTVGGRIIVSSKTPFFTPNPNGSSPRSAGKFNFIVEYDEFVKSLALNIQGSINGLKPNTDYVLSGITIIGKINIQDFTTDNLGNGTINTIYTTNRFHYCDIYNLELSMKDSVTPDMFGNELTDICPKG